MNLLKIVFDINAIDNAALALIVVGYLVVFFVLFLLQLIFLGMPKLLSIKKEKATKKTGKKISKNVNEDITGEMNAAISMALHLYLTQMHDFESDVVTIKTIDKKYSPWSSKLHSINTYFKKI